MRRSFAAVLIAVATVSPVPARAVTPSEAVPPEVAMARVEHHLREIDRLAEHFDAMLSGVCPRFSSTTAWDAYVEEERSRVVLLVAHLEQAWVEAKRTGDDDVRRAAKAPRRQLDQARQLVTKLQSCAELNGASFSPFAMWLSIERDVPNRQAEIALPR